jgi:hypothetical protein
MTSWLGDYVASGVTYVRFEPFGAELGPRLIRTAFLTAPFLLTGLFLKRQVRTSQTAVAASKVAVGIVIAGTILILCFQFYLATTDWEFRRTGGFFANIVLILGAPVWLTYLGIRGFMLTKALGTKRKIGSTQVGSGAE